MGIVRGLLIVVAVLLAGAPAAHAIDVTSPAFTAANLARTAGRGHELTPQLLSDSAALTAQHDAARLALRASDPERQPTPNFCTLQACATDPRLNDWGAHGGVVEPVLFTARDGATLSGHVWATRRGAPRRPGVFIINGSIIGYEQAYWYAAQALAKAGYVVLTFDTQGEGDSDQLGEAPDTAESLIAGTPPIGDGGPFYDGGEDALNFFLSRPAHPYEPVPSRTSQTSHAAKQDRRVKAGLDTAYNPLWRMLDRKKIGLTGHSYGAQAASYLGQYDHRISAVVGWDPLCTPQDSNQPELSNLGGSAGSVSVGPLTLPAVLNAFPRTCFGAPAGYPADVRLRTPALGLTGDYLISPAPYLSPPDPGYRARSSKDYSAARVPSGSITIQGANHIDFSWVPLPTGTLRGIDMTTWYTVAWFDRYLKKDRTADARLLTRRWRHDPQTKALDPVGDGNLFSQVYTSRLDIRTRAGKHVDCEDLRTGCPRANVARAPDCGPRDYSFVAVDTAPASARNSNRARCATRPRVR